MKVTREKIESGILVEFDKRKFYEIMHFGVDDNRIALIFNGGWTYIRRTK